MKRFGDLTGDQQRKAVGICVERLLRAINEGIPVAALIPGGGMESEEVDAMQEAIEQAWADAEATGTPWFGNLYVMDAWYDGRNTRKSNVGETLRRIAQDNAENAMYSESAEDVIGGVA